MVALRAYFEPLPAAPHTLPVALEFPPQLCPTWPTPAYSRCPEAAGPGVLEV
jgi:hypothetical protein